MIWEAPPLSIAAGAALAALAAAFAAFAGALFQAPLPGRARAALLALRAAAVVAAGLLAWRPAVGLKGTARPPVAVVIDGSGSMAARDAEGSSRAGAAAAAVSRLWPLLERRARPALFRAGRDLSPLASPAEAGAEAPVSDFSGLARAAERLSGARAVFFISDGRRGGGPDPLPLLAVQGLPVYAVGAGDPAERPDLALDGVRASPFAFQRADASAVVRLRAAGLPPGRTRLTVYDGARAVGGADAAWDASGVVEATVPFRPSRRGLRTFRVAAAPAPGEANARNNEARFTVDVARDRRRVLYVCGRPGPHHAFLRHQLKSDPSTELVSFVILRDPVDFLAVSDDELSLIPFPAQEELLSGLAEFDLVIFESFSFHRFGVGAEGARALKSFIENGGGLLVAGEADVFGPASPYRGSALEPLLPFRVGALSPGPSRFRAAPLKAGAAMMPAEGWAALPPVDGPGLFPALRPGAAALAGGDGAPAWLAAAAAGKGRMLAMAALGDWRWALDPSGLGTDFYARFWRGTLAWLAGDDALRRVSLMPPAEGAATGEPVTVRALVRDEGGAPFSGAELRLEVRAPGAAARSVPMASAGAGEYAADVSFERPGDVALRAVALRDGGAWGDAEAVLRVGGGWDEARDAAPDFAFLAEAARVTGGRFVPLAELDAAWVSRALDEAGWDVDRRIPLDGPPVLAALLACLLAEWIYRRRSGRP